MDKTYIKLYRLLLFSFVPQGCLAILFTAVKWQCATRWRRLEKSYFVYFHSVMRRIHSLVFARLATQYNSTVLILNAISSKQRHCLI